MIALVIPLSLLAGALLAGAAVLQQRAATRSKGAPVAAEAGSRAAVLPGAAFVRRLVRDRWWLAGWGVNLAGFLTQAAALHEGSVTVVQPLLVSQLLFTIALAALASHTRLRGLDYLGGLLICAGLATLITVRHIEGSSAAHADRLRLAGALVAAIVLAGLLVVAASRSLPRLRAPVLGVAAGLFFALSATLITLTTDDLVRRGVAATATDWVGYTLALTTALGLLLEQDAFASGPLPLAMTGMTITNPLTSYVLGILAFGAQLPTTVGQLALVAVAAALVAGGVAVVAHSPMLTMVQGQDGAKEDERDDEGEADASPRRDTPLTSPAS